MLRRTVSLAAAAALGAGTGCGPKVLSPMTLVTVVAANDPEQSALVQFGEDLAQGSWWPAVTREYGIAPPKPSRHVIGPPLPRAVTTAQLLAYLVRATAGGPLPNGANVYVLYLPEGTHVTDTSFEAFHQPFPSPGTTLGDVWAFVTRDRPFPGGETPLQAATRLASHEIVEAATNPSGTGFSLGETPAQPWTAPPSRSYEPTGEVEVGDLCEGTRIFLPGTEHPWEFQRSWSELAAARGGDPCVPSRDEPYFTVRLPPEWLATQPGTRVHVPMTGTASAPRGDWLVAARLTNGSGVFRASNVVPEIVSERGLVRRSPACGPYPQINEGATALVSMDVPPEARSGDWALFSVCSFDEDPVTCYPLPEQDVCHRALVGIFVP